jgi:spermidine synthase
MYDDAARYLREEGSRQNYDVIICDSSDPVGPAEALFKPEFFISMRNALAPDGLICTQGECMWLHMDLIAGVFNECKQIFPSVKYAYTTIPTYPSGQIGFIIASNGKTVDPSVPAREIPEGLPVKYYSAGIHKSAFVLPGTEPSAPLTATSNIIPVLALPPMIKKHIN